METVALATVATVAIVAIAIDQQLNFNVIIPLKKNHSTGFENLRCFLKLKTF